MSLFFPLPGFQSADQVEGRRAPFEAAVSVEEAMVVVTVRGALDLTTRPMLAETLALAISKAEGDLAVDIGQLDLVDSSGADLFLRARDFLSHRGKELILRSPTPAALEVLALVANHKVGMSTYPNRCTFPSGRDPAF